MNTAPTTHADKIRMIKLSMECHYYGLATVTPFLGPLFGIIAAFESGRARRYEKKFWNPARTHRLIGFSCAIVGMLIWVPADVRLIWAIIDSVTRSGS